MSTKPIHFTEIALKNFLSFGPEAEPVPLQSLNLVIGPNGAGKSNLIEAFELLRATPSDLTAPLREGGGPQDWLWKGSPRSSEASIAARFSIPTIKPELRYRLAFSPLNQGFEIVDERIENAQLADPAKTDVFFYYRYQNGNPVINTRQLPDPDAGGTKAKAFQRALKREEVLANQSILSQRKDPEIYPEVTAVSAAFKSIQIFREWQFGRSASLRKPQRADQVGDMLLPDLTNLGLVLNELEHRDGVWQRLNDLCRRFLPRFSHITTRVNSGTIQIYLQEQGLSSPIPATRLSDGTIRFLSLMAILLGADRYPLICIEEPELGIHPDAIAILAELLTDASKSTQLIVTTQSDVLVSAFTEDPETVLVCEHAPQSGSVLRRLKSEKLSFWLEKYRLGEIWRIGEIGGNL